MARTGLSTTLRRSCVSTWEISPGAAEDCAAPVSVIVVGNMKLTATEAMAAPKGDAR